MLKKILNILEKKDKIKLLFLFLSILFLGFLEVVGIASILPFMELLSKPNAVEQSSWLTLAYNLFQFSSLKNFLIASGLFVMGVIALSNLLAIGTTYFQLRFSWDMAHRMGTKLLWHYASKPYSYFLNQNTSELRAYLAAEVATVTTGILIPLIQFISRAIVCLVIFLLLLAVSPQVTLTMAFFLGGTYFLIYLTRQQFLKRLGKDRMEANAQRYRYLEEMLTGIKTVKIYGALKPFYRRYEDKSALFSEVQPKVQMVYATPKYILEILAFGGIMGVTLYLFITTGDLTKSLPRLSLYVVAGYRLLPALQGAFASIAKLKHNIPSLDKLYDDLIESKGLKVEGLEDMPAPLGFHHQISINQLSFTYENAMDGVLNELNLAIDKGQKVAFVGATGSGKTTLVDIIIGLLFASSGSVQVDGQEIHEGNTEQWQRNIAYVPQEVFLYDDTVRANIAIGIKEELIDEEALAEALKMAEIYDFVINELPDGLATKIGERGVRLSGGQRQRLGLARALYRKPSLLILDEATSALDSITEQSVIASLQSLPQDLTTITIAHRMSTVKYADTIFLLEKGQIVDSGKYEDLLNNNSTFQQMAREL